MWIVDTHRMIVPNDEDGRTFTENMKALMAQCKVSETTSSITIETLEIRQIFYTDVMKGGAE